MYKYYVTEWGNGMMVNIILDCNMDWIIPPFPTFSTSKFFLVSDLRGVKGDLMKILWLGTRWSVIDGVWIYSQLLEGLTLSAMKIHMVPS